MKTLPKLATPADFDASPAFDPPPPGGLAVLSWSDLAALPPDPPPTIAAGIPKVGLTVQAGPPKVGKTLWASQTALEVGRSTMVIEEGSLAGVSYRLRHQAAALGIDVPDVAVIHRQRIRLDNRAHVGRLREHVAARRPVIVIFDPLNRLHGGDENRPSQMTPVMDALAGIAYDFGCAVVAIHHLAKPSAERRGDIWDRFRGATSIRSGTDANLVMDGSGSTVRLVGEFRDAEPLSMYLELDRDSLLFSEVDGPRIAGKIDPAALRAYVEETGQVTARDVAARFAVQSKETARTSLESLAGIDSYDGPRGTRFYTLGTAQ
jgi:hypothetical protein